MKTITRAETDIKQYWQRTVDMQQESNEQEEVKGSFIVTTDKRDKRIKELY